MGSIPISVLAFVRFFSNRPDQGNLDIVDILGFTSLLLLFFTVYWFYRYTQLASKQQNMTVAEILQKLWIGLVANIICIICGVLVAIGKVLSLLYVMLSLPAGAAKIFNPVPGATVLDPFAQVVVPLDMIGLLAMMSSIAAGLLGIIISLWLLHQVTVLR